VLYAVTLSDGRVVRVHADDPASVFPHVVHQELTNLILAVKRGQTPVTPATPVSMEQLA
jgi:hypothetical protein